MTAPRVSLVGAGPGDPALLTLRARECLEEADVVLYDSLVDLRCLRFARPGCELVNVGKRGGALAREQQQDEINARLLAEARAGRRVVRLKGGDPFLFGRGGEEAWVLAAAAVSFEIVPGVTSAIAVPAYAGIPVTHRGASSAVAVATGHEASDAAERVDWAVLAKTDTVVILMGRKRIREVVSRLVAAGRDAETPAACISNGTLPSQRTIAATLERLPDLVEAADLPTPCTLVVGAVVRLRDRLGWFERLPLLGRRIVVTRPRHQASGFAGRLERLGAEVVEAAAIEIERRSPDELERVLERLAGFDWIVFTSRNGVDAFFDALLASGRDVRSLSSARLAVIGPATAVALASRGLRADLVPTEFHAEGLRDALVPEARGSRVLLARAGGARAVLPDALRAAGAEVEDLETYHAVPAPALPDAVRESLRDGSLDAVTFTSSSTVKSFVSLLDPETRKALEAVRIAAIGPVTAETARSLGLAVAIEAREHTTDGLLRALVDSLGPRG